ncbi:TIGR04219 family outer membrane beta-barrel protein [Psychromonas sp. RZ22]|nr:TIGR04219 family outer membrane beta-barrel protein [Psychromonas sp. RZ22]
MKKHALAAIIAASVSMPSMADHLGIYTGIDYQNNETSFEGASIDSDTSNNFSGYVAFEHFIPLIPNVKVKYSDLTNSDIKKINNSDDGSSMANGILYYQLFDNDLFEFDFGLAYTRIESYDEKADLAQGYGAAKLHIPGMGMYAFAEGIGGSVTDDKALDMQGGLAYTFNPDSALINFTVRAGYRVQEMEFENSVTPQQKNKGLFAGVELHF